MNSKLTTAVRMFLGFSIAPLGLLLLALYGLSNLATLRDQATTIVNQDWPKIEPIMQIATGVRDNARNTRDLLLNKDNAQARESLQATKQRITQAMDTLGPLLYLPKGQALFRQLKTHREAYVAAFSEVLALVQQGQMEQASSLLQARVVPAELQVYDSLNGLMALQSEVFAQRGNTAVAIYANVRATMLGILLVCLALVVAAGLIVTRSVTRPLGGEPLTAAQIVRQIAKGDLSGQVPVRSGDTESLMADMQGMQQSLREVYAFDPPDTEIFAIAGAAAGWVTAWLNVRLNILQLLASILVMIALYSINLRVMGAPNVALIGTSFSRNSNFVAFLEQALGASLGNFAKDGGEFSGAARDYFASPAFRETPPQLLIWEIPERDLQSPYKDDIELPAL